MIQNTRSQLVGFDQISEVLKRGAVPYSIRNQIDADKPNQIRHVIECVVRPFVGKALPKLHEVNTKHAFDNDGQAAKFTWGGRTVR